MPNKSDVTQKMKELGGIPKSKAEDMLDLTLLGIIETLKDYKDEPYNKKNIRAKLTMVGFGSMELRRVPEREHRNPQNPTETHIKPEHNTIKFNVGKLMNDAINEE